MLTANGYPLAQAPDRLGALEEANSLIDNPTGLRDSMQANGYLFIRGLIPRKWVMDARLEVLQKFAILGEIDDRHPIADAIAGDRGGVASANLRAFSKSVRSGREYLRVTNAPQIVAVHEALLEGEVRSFDFRWPRLVRPHEGCGFHCDGPYMARGTSTARIFTSWIPLGDVAQENGALLLLENSHRTQDQHSGYLAADADQDGLTWMTDDPVKLQDQLGGRWLTADFTAGDVLFFGMHMVHGSLDNRSANGACRLSSDTRYQRADEPADHRWNGEENGEVLAHGGQRVFYPGLGRWRNADFADEWKHVDEFGRIIFPGETDDA